MPEQFSLPTRILKLHLNVNLNELFNGSFDSKGQGLLPCRTSLTFQLA